MSAVKFHTPPNRLARLLKRSGGLSVSTAVRVAERNLDGIRQACRDALNGQFDEMKAVLETPALSIAEKRTRLYRLSNDVFGCAGAVGMSHLSDAAYSLCEALDRMTMADAWQAESIEVHVAALLALKSVDGQDQICQQILDGLRQVALREQRPKSEVLP